MTRATDAYEGRMASGTEARALEAAAFAFVNRQLENASGERERIKALGTSQKLWSMLIKDVALAGNRLPPVLKDDLVKLARWAMQYGIQAIGSDMPLEPLIAINREMIEGLRAAPASAEASGVTAMPGAGSRDAGTDAPGAACPPVARLSGARLSVASPALASPVVARSPLVCSA